MLKNKQLLCLACFLPFLLKEKRRSIKERINMNDFAMRILSKELLRRKEKNQLYSLRAFARDLGVAPSCLSEFFEKKRDLSSNSANKIASRLKIPKDSMEDFILSAQSNRSSELLEKDYFEVMSYWHYFAILNLAGSSANQADPHWIAERLAIETNDAIQALSSLEEMSLIRIESGRMYRSMNALQSKVKIPGKIIKQHYKSLMYQAGISLVRDNSHLRDMRAITIPIDPKYFEQASELLINCRDKIVSLFSHTEKPRLYMLAYYLFPVSK